MVGTVVLALLAAVSLSTLVSAQSEIRISRPLDGATVRETVNILVPASAVPVGGFVACTIDGIFRAALATTSEDEEYFVYRWDTKATAPTPKEGQGRARDGKHAIAVQAYDADGKKVGTEKQIAVYVKNSASSDMPAEGLKLRYNHAVGTEARYKFKYTVDLKSIQGATNLTAAAGEGFEGAEGLVKRSVEDIMPEGTVLVRQKLMGSLERYQGGRSMPVIGLIPKAFYHVEDSQGRTTYVMTSSSPGAPVSVDLPNLPTQRVRIGDTWTQQDKILRDAVTGNSASLTTTGTLEGLEWEGGHPCAKIRTTFSGTVRIPFSAVFTQPISVSGVKTTYFAYRVGKVISTVTRISAEPTVDAAIANSLGQALSPQGAAAASAAGFAPGFGAPQGGPVAGSSAAEGPAAFGPPPTYPAPPTGYEGTGAPEATVTVKLEINERVELVY